MDCFEEVAEYHVKEWRDYGEGREQRKQHSK